MFFRKFDAEKLSIAICSEIENILSAINRMYGDATRSDSIRWAGFVTGVGIAQHKTKLTPEQFLEITFSSLEFVARMVRLPSLDPDLQEVFKASIEISMECSSGEWAHHPEGCFLKKRVSTGEGWDIPHAFFFSYMMPHLEGLSRRLKRST